TSLNCFRKIKLGHHRPRTEILGFDSQLNWRANFSVSRTCRSGHPCRKGSAQCRRAICVWFSGFFYCFFAFPGLAPCRGSSVGFTYLISHGPVPCYWIIVSPLAIP